MTVVVEETVQTNAIAEDVKGIDNANTPSHSAVTGNAFTAVDKFRIVPYRAGNRSGDNASFGVWLPVCGFGLQVTSYDVLGSVELVLVKIMMLRSGAKHPECTGGCRSVDTSAGVDGNPC